MSRFLLLFCLIAGNSSFFAQSLRPAISTNGVVNAADFTAAVAPGMVVSVFGTNLASGTVSAAAVPLPTTLSGTSVEVNGQAMPLFFVSPNQVNAQMPFGISGSVQVTVRTAAGVSAPAAANLGASAPRLFTKTMDGKGEPILVHSADWTLVSAASPARAGEYVILFLTGLGAVTPAISAGQPGGDNGRYGPLNQLPSGAATVTFGGKPAPISFAGLAPGFVGLYQINFQTPSDIPTGTFPLTVSTRDGASQAGVTAPARSAPPAPVPVISSLSSNNAEQGETFELVVRGSNLAGATALKINPGRYTSGSAADITVSDVTSSANEVKATVAVAPGTTVGDWGVTVTTPGGTSNSLTFYIVYAAPAGSSIYAGAWSGTTNQGRAVSFTVRKSSISAFTYDVNYPGGGYSCPSSATTFFFMPFPISGDSFSYSNNSITGTFSSPNTVSGTIKWSSSVPNCSGSGTLTFNATRQ
jgi:uncharacterized protein (TIGR03437 family)